MFGFISDGYAAGRPRRRMNGPWTAELPLAAAEDGIAR